MEKLRRIFGQMKASEKDPARLRELLGEARQWFASGNARLALASEARFPRALAMGWLDEDPMALENFIRSDQKYPTLSAHMGALRLSARLSDPSSDPVLAFKGVEALAKGYLESKAENVGKVMGYAFGHVLGQALRRGMDASRLRRGLLDSKAVQDKKLFWEGYCDGYGLCCGAVLSKAPAWVGMLASRYEEWESAAKKASLAALVCDLSPQDLPAQPGPWALRELYAMADRRPEMERPAKELEAALMGGYGKALGGMDPGQARAFADLSMALCEAVENGSGDWRSGLEAMGFPSAPAAQALRLAQKARAAALSMGLEAGSPPGQKRGASF